MIALRVKPKLVEMVCVLGKEDYTTELEWDDKYPLPPEGTRILGLNGHQSSRLIARHNTTGELYFLSYKSESGYQWKIGF